MFCHYSASAAPPLCYNKGWPLSAVAPGGVASETSRSPVMGRTSQTDPEPSFEAQRINLRACRRFGGLGYQCHTPRGLEAGAVMKIGPHLSRDGEASFAPRIGVAFAVAADRRALRKTRRGSTIMTALRVITSGGADTFLNAATVQ